jgi:hypothetical protein
MEKISPPLPGQIVTVPHTPQFKTPTPVPELPTFNGDPVKFLEAMMDAVGLDVRLRFEAAKTLMPYKYPKLGEEGKKSKQKDAAGQAAKGRFGTRGSGVTPPPLPNTH